MSGRQRHLRANRIARRIGLGVATGTATWLAYKTWDAPYLSLILFWYFGMVAGLFLGDYVGPDMDQEAVSGEEWDAIRAWPWPLGFVWIALWYPYAKCFKHRSFLSHAPIVSTIFRWLWLTTPAWAALAWYGWIHARWIYAPLAAAFLVGLYAGLVVTDFAHWIEDYL